MPDLNAALPPLVLIAMTVVGLELSAQDLLRVLRYPAHALVAVVGQTLTLPLLGVGIVMLLRPEPAVAGGILLVSVAPQATASNVFSLLARGDLALSVALTGASSLLALATIPIAAHLAFGAFPGHPAGLAIPPGMAARQIVLGLMVPIALGMGVRQAAPDFVARHRLLTRSLTMITLVLMLGIMVVQHFTVIVRDLPTIGAACALFTAGAALLAVGFARAFTWPKSETVTMVFGFSLRSLSVATLIAVDVLNRPEFLAFAAPFFVIQAVMMIPVVLVSRRGDRRVD
jgi:BASS family bile acid:Na+ symporter